MPRRFLLLSFVAFAAYSVVAPLLSVAMETIPSTTAVFLSNLVMFGLLGALLVVTGVSPRPYLSHPITPYVVVWGTLLAVGLLAYYHALSLGPVSVVVPVYGLFIVVSSVIGILAFDEELTPRKAASFVLAVVAIALMSI